MRTYQAIFLKMNFNNPKIVPKMYLTDQTDKKLAQKQLPSLFCNGPINFIVIIKNSKIKKKNLTQKQYENFTYTEICIYQDF